MRIARMLAAGEASDVAKALDLISPKAKPSAEDKAFSAFVGSWSRMGAKERRLALAWLAEQGLPKGFSITGQRGDA